VTSFYVAFQVALVVGVILLAALLAEPRVRTRRFLGRLAIAGALALAIVLPLAMPYLTVRDAQGFERTVREAAAYEAGPVAYLRVAWPNHVWRWTTLTTARKIPSSPALRAGRRDHRPARLAAHRAIVGTTVLIASSPSSSPSARPGTPARTAPARAALPLPLRPLPFFKALRVPARFGVLVDLAIIVLAGLGAARPGPGSRRASPPRSAGRPPSD